MAVIFDLDLTLIDSREVAELRTQRRWQEVYTYVPKISSYEGVAALIIELHERSIPVCIVTSSPRPYCERIVTHHGWPIAKTVCYHDTRLHKPHPAPILEAIKLLNVDPSRAVSVGDDPKDTQAARAAGVFSVGAIWGAENAQALIASQPDAICYTVGELHELIFSRFAQ